MKTLTFESGTGGKVIHTRERRRGAKVYNQEILGGGGTKRGGGVEEGGSRRENKYQKWIELDWMGGISL